MKTGTRYKGCTQKKSSSKKVIVFGFATSTAMLGFLALFLSNIMDLISTLLGGFISPADATPVYVVILMLQLLNMAIFMYLYYKNGT